MKYISLIVVAFDSNEDIQMLIDSIEFDPDFSVDLFLFYNDGATSYKLYSPDWIHIHEFSENYNVGFSAANNHLIRVQERGDYFIVINPDIEFNLTSIYQICRESDNYPVPVALSPILLRSYNLSSKHIQVDSAGISVTWFGRFYDVLSGRYFRSLEDLGRSAESQKFLALCGAFILFNKSGFDLLSKVLFDEKFFVYKEDIDLSFRLRAAGVQLVRRTDLFVIHRRGWKSRSNVSIFTKSQSLRGDWILFKRYAKVFNFLFWLSFLISKQIVLSLERFLHRLLKT